MDAARADGIAKLRHHPAFQDLAAEIDDAEARYWGGVNKKLRAGEVLDQRELDFMRGKFAAARLIVTYPDKALRTLERAKETDPVEK